MADDDSSVNNNKSFLEEAGDSSRMSEQDLDRSSGDSPIDGGKGQGLLSPSPLLDIHKGRPIRLQVRVLVPVKDHPNFNFVGKLLGPKGNSLKRLQEETQTKMAILGRGSMRDKAKEEELRNLGDSKHNHLNEDLHVEITSFAPPAEAYGRLAHALAEVKRFLVPDYYDDIRQNQLRELAILNGDRKKAKLGNGGGPLGGPDGNGGDLYALMDSDDETRPPSPPQQPGPGPPQGGPGGPGGQGQALVSRTVNYVSSRHMGASQGGGPPSGGHPSNKNGAAPQSRQMGGRTFVGQTRVATFRKAMAPLEARVQYITEEDAYTFEEGYPNESAEVITKQFPRLRTGTFLEYDDLPPEEVSEIYDGNGYGPKEFAGEEWVSASRGVSRLKSRGVTARPVVYREHPYFPPSVARY